MTFKRTDSEDFKQERLARELEKEAGVPSPPVDRNREYTYGLSAGEGAVPAFRGHDVNWEALDQVVEWSLQQSAEIRLAVVEYLEDPDELQLERLAAVAGLEIKPREYVKPATLTDMIMRALPATRDELYDLARQHHRSKRPEAAVRQTIRRQQRKGLVYEDLEGRICPIR